VNTDAAIVFGLLAATILLFASDRLRLDLVAVLALLGLLLTGVLTPAEALGGFSDPLVLIVAGLFVVGGGLLQTGVASALGEWLSRVAGTSEARLIVVVMLLVAALSAFMSSTGTVAVLLPVVISLAWKAKISPSRVLIPLAYASLLGGMLTLIGTPPNLVVSNQLATAGLAPFGFFAFTPLGLVMLGIGVAFMLLAGRRMLPQRTRRGVAAGGEEALSISELTRAYGLPGNATHLRVQPDSPLVGLTLAETNLRARYRVNVLEHQAWPARQPSPSRARPATPATRLQARDILRVQGQPDEIGRLIREAGLSRWPSQDGEARFHSDELGLAEVLLTPRSALIGKTLQEVQFRHKYHVTVLASLRLGEPLASDLAATPLRFGDALLVQGAWENIDLLRDEHRDFVVVGQPREMSAGQRWSPRAPLAVAIMAAMLLLMTTGVVPTVSAVLLAAVAMVLSRCLTAEEAYRTINWESVVLIAGMLPMATALEKTGGVQIIVDGLTAHLGGLGPLAVMAGLFVLTSGFSQFISNTATAVLMAPIALQSAASLSVAPAPFLMTVALAASTAFATPIASPVNTLVLGPGGYRFGDYARVGLALQALILLATLILVPLLFPL
jgi:di/tricarboxylate transporter